MRLPHQEDQPTAVNGGKHRGEPDTRHCCVKLAGFGDYMDCLAPRPDRCIHALTFGDGHLCLHPERHTFFRDPKPN